MPSWNPEQYLQFAEERARPCRELAQRLALSAPRAIVDLGCGPGNSTAVLAARFPGAALAGLDSSPEMIAAARRSGLAVDWSIGDVLAWATGESAPLDLVFSNAAFQWVPEHARLMPALMGHVAPGGALAFQMPANKDAPAHEAARALARSARWQAHFPAPVREWDVRPAEIYYDLLAPQAARIDLWVADYLQVMPGPEAILAWYQGSGLRPYLDALPDEAARAGFAADYLALIREAYPPRPNGRILFPFRRLFCIAYRD